MPTPIERGRQKLFEGPNDEFSHFGELFESQEVSCTVSLFKRGRQGLLATDEEDYETSDINLRDFFNGEADEEDIDLRKLFDGEADGEDSMSGNINLGELIHLHVINNDHGRAHHVCEDVLNERKHVLLPKQL